MKLKDKVAIITGAGSGLGRASALVFSKNGAKVVVADIVTKDAEETVQMIEAGGGDAISVLVDVSKSADCQKMIKAVIDTYGKLDIMFNNAGIGGKPAKIADCSEEEWDRIISINLRGTFLGTKYAIPEMIKGGGGVIISTASVGAVIPMRSSAAYGASKAGVLYLTRVAALEHARNNIRANCILPGGMDTSFMSNMFPGDPKRIDAMEQFSIKNTPLGRLASPAEVARIALFLASDDSSFVTGAAWNADGGWLLR